MQNSIIIIREECLDDAMEISKQIPEFENPYGKSEYDKRLKNVRHLIITAYIKEQPVGFKIGYETQSRQYFYSWMGGVLPRYRQMGIAERLSFYQKDWAKRKGYNRIIIKTRIKHKSMIELLRKNNYTEIGRLPYSPEEETRIIFEKEI